MVKSTLCSNSYLLINVSCVCVHVLVLLYTCVCARVRVCISEENLWELVLSFHGVGPGDLNLDG